MKTTTIKNNWLNDSDLRVDASYHLSDGVKTKRIIEKLCPYPTTILKDEAIELFKGNIHKRVYASSPEHGYMFFTASDLFKSELDSGKYVSKKHSPYLKELELKKDWILITRSGTLGNVLYTTSDLEGKIGTDDLVRIKPKEKDVIRGYLYAYLASRYGYGLLTQSGYGGVVKHIEPHHIENLPIPILPQPKQQEIHNLIVEAANLRVEANKLLKEARTDLKKDAGLRNLNSLDFEYFGQHSKGRPLSVFKRNISELSTVTINAFNYSKRVETLEDRVRASEFITLSECLDENQFFSSGSFKRLELYSPNSIKLINQSDIFHIRKQGKLLAKRFVKADKLVEYGEVIIAGVGTLGEGETFCRVVFGNEELEGQLISGEFIRMKTNKKIPSGYLFCWLSTDYGFRLIRRTQSGTKLCRPIQEMLKNIPVPILKPNQMEEIDIKVKKAHTLMYSALSFENQAIDLVEKEIESWQK